MDDQRLLDAVQDALARELKMRESREYARTLQNRFGRPSNRERQVMELVVAGLLNKQVAAE